MAFAASAFNLRSSIKYGICVHPPIALSQNAHFTKRQQAASKFGRILVRFKKVEAIYE
jgi:hypothetical protein